LKDILWWQGPCCVQWTWTESLPWFFDAMSSHLFFPPFMLPSL
jgi:hypothetical protein